MVKIMEDNSLKNCQKFEWGEVVWVHEPTDSDMERLSAGLVKFYPHTYQSRHFHFGEEQILYVIKGNGIQKINKVEYHIKEGMLIHCPPYSEHEISNPSSQELLMLIAYSPSRFSRYYRLENHYYENITLENIEKDMLLEMLNNISSFEKIPISVVDNKGNKIVSNDFDNMFYELMVENKIYENNKNIRKEKILKSGEIIYDCLNNIMEMQVPITINSKVLGYIKCGYLLIDKTEKNYERLRQLSSEKNIDFNKLLLYYNEIPILPKSRLYSLGEFFELLSSIIVEILIKKNIEEELSSKNMQILEKTKEMIMLENSLNEANIKLLKLRYTNVFENIHNQNSNPFVSNNYPIDFELEIVDAIEKLNLDQSLEIIHRYFNSLKNQEPSIHEVMHIIDEVSTVIIRSVCNVIDDKDLILLLRKEYKTKIRNAASLKKLEEEFKNIVINLIEILREISFSTTSSLITRINKYIQKNYMDNLTLSFVAEVFHLSPNYLSAIFNHSNETSFTDYINMVRIEKAKYFLSETNYKISEITKRIGYTNPSYFGSVFKKFEGISPSCYRKRFLKGGISE